MPHHRKSTWVRDLLLPALLLRRRRRQAGVALPPLQYRPAGAVPEVRVGGELDALGAAAVGGGGWGRARFGETHKTRSNSAIRTKQISGLGLGGGQLGFFRPTSGEGCSVFGQINEQIYHTWQHTECATIRVEPGHFEIRRKMHKK